jgi:hypothetical protein
MNLLEEIPERGYGESVGDVNIYKREAFIEADVTYNTSYRLDAYLPHCLFPWHYNPLWLYFPQPSSELWPPRFRGLLITNNDAPQSVGLLWTSDQSVAETST